MTAQYFTVLTNYGTQAFAKALATNQPLRLSSFAVGDGNGQAVTPTADRTALVKETHRANVSAVSLDPRNNKQIIIELTIPEDVGGFYIREMGVFDSTNKLVAYANAPESFKPTLESGSGKVQVLRMILKVSNSQAVTLSIDNSVIFVTRQQLNPKKITSSTTNGFDESGHTHEIEKADTTKAGIVQLTDDTGLDSDKLGLSARAGKKLAQLISTVQLALGNYIQINKKSNSVTSTSNDNVATSSAVKTAYDKGVEAKTAADAAQRTANDGVSKANTAQHSADNANTNANGRVSKSGDEINGNLRINGQDGNWSKIQFGSKNGVWELEVHPESHNAVNRRFNMKYNGDSTVFLAFPAIGDNGEIVAYRSWVEDRTTPWSKIDGKPAFATRWPNAAEQGYSHSLGRTGWTKLPSGLIIQWGEVNGMGVHKFPIAFNNVGQVFVCERSYSDDGEIVVVRDVNNTSFRAWARKDMGAFLFFAIGS
nr:MAG TPA: tail collar fiber protein [Caudoviricetes sp.]